MCNDGSVIDRTADFLSEVAKQLEPGLAIDDSGTLRWTRATWQGPNQLQLTVALDGQSIPIEVEVRADRGADRAFRARSLQYSVKRAVISAHATAICMAKVVFG